MIHVVHKIFSFLKGTIHVALNLRVPFTALLSSGTKSFSNRVSTDQFSYAAVRTNIAMAMGPRRHSIGLRPTKEPRSAITPANLLDLEKTKRSRKVPPPKKLFVVRGVISISSLVRLAVIDYLRIVV